MTTAINLQDLITQEANAQGVPPSLALSVAAAESNFNPSAVSPKGAVGVFQLLPSSFPGQDIGDVYTNVNLGVGYLAQLYEQFGDWFTALAAYNWGPGNVNKALASGGSIPSSVASYATGIVNNSGLSAPTVPDTDVQPDDSQIVGLDPSIIAPVVLVGVGTLLLWLAWD